jgi:hypothetical protein
MFLKKLMFRQTNDRSAIFRLRPSRPGLPLVSRCLLSTFCHPNFAGGKKKTGGLEISLEITWMSRRFVAASEEFSLRHMIVTSSTSAARLLLHSSEGELTWLSIRRQVYVST